MPHHIRLHGGFPGGPFDESILVYITYLILNGTVTVFEIPPEIAVTATLVGLCWAEVNPVQPVIPAEAMASNARVT